MQSTKRRRTIWYAVAAWLAGVSAARAGGFMTLEDHCQAKRGRALASYLKCEEHALAPVSLSRLLVRYGVCVTRYAATWTRLQARLAGSGTTCDNPRFTDNGDGTVTDRLTTLQWEKKTDDSMIHDEHNT